ncbi:MAG: hypothetical protein KAQ85_07850, partial [Thermodesulfovibrionia bacterium]|nr:hypothetical protein [Thermodesulfovibrionia bacterium]
VVESHLKVMLEEDYVALQKNLGSEKYGMEEMMQAEAEVISGVSSEIVREILIPEIEKEVNEGKTFASLRQIYNSMILATWYKKNLKESLLGQVYMDKNKIRGIDVEDKEINQKIYNQYLTAFKKGVYNYIKEDYDPTTQQIIPRKYFSGGAKFDIKKIFKDKDEMTNLTLERFIEFLHALDSEKLSPKSARKLIAKRNTFDAQGREACDAALRNEALEKIRVRLDEFSEDGLEAEEKASSPVLTVKEHLTPFVKAKTESVGIFEAELGMAKALLETAIDKVIEIRIISKNGKESTIHIPDEGNEGLMNDVYLRYVAKIYARSMAIGNGPYDFLYVEAKDKQGNIKSNVEDALKKIVMEYFESEGNPLLSKANGGEQVKVLSADQYTGKKSFRSQGKITAGIFDGGGVGVILTDELGEIDGLNEGGHFSNNIRDDYKRYIESENSPSGSIELEAGSVPSILHVAELIGVNEEMEESFSIENVTPEHIGWVAAGFNPIDHKTLLSKDSKIQKLCLDVWDEIGKREAQAILHMHLLYGGEILDFIIGGGSMRGETGKIREGITREYLRRYEKELKTIYEEIGKKHEIKSGFFTEPIKVDLVQADNAGRGAALKAKELAVQKFGSLSEKDVLVGFDIGGKGFKPYVMDAAGNDITAELLGEENES